MRTIRLVTVWSLLAVVALHLSPVPAAADRGWGHLIDKLVRDGIARARVLAVFNDRRVPPFSGMSFSLEPAEPRSMYRQFRRSSSIARARRCRRQWDRAFRAAEARMQVPASVLGAILHVETQCGLFTGKNVVLYRLARLAMANEPANVRRNIKKHRRGVPAARTAAVARRVRSRARHIESIFYPEVLATFELAERLHIDPLGIRGSGSGAFGLPQFLPSSYLRFAIDGNRDRRVSLYDPADAIASAANYLQHHGWRPGLTRAEQRRVIWAYNRSDAYVDTVLYVADRIEETYPSP